MQQSLQDVIDLWLMASMEKKDTWELRCKQGSMRAMLAKQEQRVRKKNATFQLSAELLYSPSHSVS